MGGAFAPQVFLDGDPFCQGFLNRHLLCRIRYCQRPRQGLTQEGAFAKGESNLGAVVPGSLAPGVFGTGCAVTFEISKTVQMSGNYTTCRQVAYMSYCKVKMDSKLYA